MVCAVDPADLLPLQTEELRRVSSIIHVPMVSFGNPYGHLLHDSGQLPHFPDPATSVLLLLWDCVGSEHVLSTISVPGEKHYLANISVYCSLGWL